MCPPLTLTSRRLRAEQGARRLQVARTGGASLILWLAACAALGTALVLLVRQLATMEAAIVLAGRV